MLAGASISVVSLSNRTPTRGWGRTSEAAAKDESPHERGEGQAHVVAGEPRHRLGEGDIVDHAADRAADLHQQPLPDESGLHAERVRLSKHLLLRVCHLPGRQRRVVCAPSGHWPISEAVWSAMNCTTPSSSNAFNSKEAREVDQRSQLHLRQTHKSQQPPSHPMRAFPIACLFEDGVDVVNVGEAEKDDGSDEGGPREAQVQLDEGLQEEYKHRDQEHDAALDEQRFVRDDVLALDLRHILGLGQVAHCFPLTHHVFRVCCVLWGPRSQGK